MEKKQRNQNELIAHVTKKFGDYARPRHIEVLGVPQMCNIAYKRKRTQHMAVPALAPEEAFIKDPAKRSGSVEKVEGYLVNLGDWRFKFLPNSEAIVHQLPEGADIEKLQRGKKRLQPNHKL